MIPKIYTLLEESTLARSLLIGTSGAAAIVFGTLAIVAGIAALASSAWWVLGFVGFGLLAGVSAGLIMYIYEEHY